MDIPMYEGNLNIEELLDWFRALDKYFDYEDIEEDKISRYQETWKNDAETHGHESMNFSARGV
jgi:hypothetical protein